ncbi:MAG: hypothetical protein VX639_02940 [Pseudomonadota bacterium]|nr:hypothetical protein [Pseudomonadota bacterium]
MFDLLIKNADIYDGNGSDPVKENNWVKAGKVAGIGSDAPTVRETVAADSVAVMPGFVDLHTYYDAQVTWDPTC